MSSRFMNLISKENKLKVICRMALQNVKQSSAHTGLAENIMKQLRVFTLPVGSMPQGSVLEINILALSDKMFGIVKRKGKFKLQIVPWKNKEEWCMVYRNLFSHSVEDQIWALGLIAAWKSKAQPSLPLGIETTASLISAQVNELQNQNNGYTEDNARLLYGMAIVRFINFVAELGQNNKHDLSIYVAVKSFNIPTWVVEMRHHATHSTMPSLTLLKSGVNFALTWLHDNYWSRISFEEVCHVPINVTVIRDQINELVKILHILRYEYLFVSQNSYKVYITSQKSIVIKIKKLCKENKELVFRTLSLPNNFIMDDKTIKLLLDPKSKRLFEEGQIPPNFVKLCFPLLKIMFTESGVEDFIEGLLNNVKEGLFTPYQKIFVYMWIVLITSIFVTCESWVKFEKCIAFSTIVELAQTYKLNWLRVVKVLAQLPGSFVKELLPKVISHENCCIPNYLESHLGKLFAVQNGYVELTCDEKTDFDRSCKLYSSSNFQDAVNNITAVKSESNHAVNNSGWELVNDCDWSKYSIGVLPESFECNDNDAEMEEENIELADSQDVQERNELSDFIDKQEDLLMQDILENIDIY
ncbi:Ribosomal biogenesis protein LAS1L [Nymphon striatum]|nr:Ribosomal biogenesis protein LAS1L [Nymphon striatum]